MNTIKLVLKPLTVLLQLSRCGRKKWIFYEDYDGSFLENWRNKSVVSTLHQNATKSLMDCVGQLLAYPEYVLDCCVILEDSSEHHIGFDYYFRCFNEDGDWKICLGMKPSSDSSVFDDHLDFKSDDDFFHFHGILCRLEKVFRGLKFWVLRM